MTSQKYDATKTTSNNAECSNNGFQSKPKNQYAKVQHMTPYMLHYYWSMNFSTQLRSNYLFQMLNTSAIDTAHCNTRYSNVLSVLIWNDS